MLMIDRDEGLWHPKILLAEDDTAVRRSLQLLLLGQNLDVRSYATSSELIADETNRDALCLISDYRMPGLDGISLLRQMRFLGWGGRAALITAYRSPQLEAEAALTGYELNIDKPVRGQPLLDSSEERRVGKGGGSTCRSRWS